MRMRVESGFVFSIFLVLALVLSSCMPVTRATSPAVHASARLMDAAEEYMSRLPGPSPQLFQTTYIYDRHGNLLGEVFDEGRRTWVSLDQISPWLIKATIAVEDRTFYDNVGVDWTGVARAALRNVAQGDVVEGGSTITQQLARHLIFTFEERAERTVERKLREAELAQELTGRFAKDEILEMYLNIINYGALAYGIEAAANTYFNKSAADLTLAEAALLAGLPQRPRDLDPFRYFENAKARQRVVLDLMVRNEMITPAEAEAAAAEELNLSRRQINNPAPHFTNYVRQYLSQRLGANVVSRGGLRVYTSLDVGYQTLGQQIVRDQIGAVRDRFDLSNAALVAMRPGTGEILAMVGSADPWDATISGQINMTLAERQPGSAIKPLLYAVAFAEGWTPADLLWDLPVRFDIGEGRAYEPRNIDHRVRGALTLRSALANSYNIPAVKLLHRIGVSRMLDAVHAMGITGLQRGPEFYGLSLTLGGGEVSLLDLTTAFNTLANNGHLVRPQPILRVEDAFGRVLLERPVEIAAEPVIDPGAAYLVTHVLSDNQARSPMFGSGAPLRVSRPAAVKTGTTDNWRDNWTVGYTRYLSVGVWAGNADNRPMRGATGLTGAAPIWNAFMEAVLADPEKLSVLEAPADAQAWEFPRPDNVVSVQLCDVFSLDFGPECPATISELIATTDDTQNLNELVNEIEGRRWQRVPVSVLAYPVVEDATAPALCRVAGAEMATGGEVAFIVVNGDSDEQEKAWRWGAQVGLPVMPLFCDDSRLAEVPVIASLAQSDVPHEVPGGRAVIMSPSPGAVLTEPVPVIGTAEFDPNVFVFYKVEWGQGHNPSDWVTMGDVHYNSVVGGQLEFFHAPALPPGPYALRVVLVRHDGNWIHSPIVPVNIAPAE